METSKRIAPWAVLLLLAATAAWWWHGRAKPADAASMPRREASPTLRGAPSPKADMRAQISPADIARAEAAMKQCEADMAAPHRQRWEALGAKDDVESRLAHALMASMPGEDTKQPSTSALLDALVAAAPGDVEVAWYRASHCPMSSGCDRDKAIGRLLELEPENLDGWLMALSEASQRKQDEATMQALLEHAAQAKYYDPRTGETFSRLYQAMRDLPLPKSCGTPMVAQAWRDAFGGNGGPTAADLAVVWAMTGSLAEIKAYGPIHTLCKSQDAPLAPERAAACRPIMTKLADGDGLLDQVIGTGAMIGLAADPAESAQWRERYRNLYWLMDNPLRGTHFDHDAVVRQMTEGETLFLQDQLRAQGRWPAPEGWLPANDRARSLIQTGRPPPETRH